jgi:hypothetical protein
MARQFINRIYVVLWHAKELTNLYLGGNRNVVNLIVLGLSLVFAIWIAEMVPVLAAGSLNPDSVTGTALHGSDEPCGHFRRGVLVGSGKCDGYFQSA